MKPLLGASLALVAQNLSCAYYLLYFTPFAAAYAVVEDDRAAPVAQRACVAAPRHRRAMTVALTAPFLLPYAEVRQRFEMARALSEVTRFSADLYSYATAFAEQPLWGRVMRAFPKPEGDLFPGLVPLVLAAIGLMFFRLPAFARRGDGEPEGTRARRIIVTLLCAAAIVYAAAAVATVVFRRIAIDLGPFELQMSNVNQLLLRATVAFTLVLGLSRRARSRTAAFLRERGFFVVGLVAAVWLSLGPSPQVLGRPLELAAPYRILYEYVPGFEGVRAPARFAMVGVFMLAVLGGYGAACLARSKWGRRALIPMAAAFLLEGTAVPFLVNGVTPPRNFRAPEARLYRPARAPAIYREAGRQLGDGVLVELPLGLP